MKKTTYAKLSKFLGKAEDNLDYSVTEFTEEKITEYATNKFIAYRTIQDNYTEAKNVKILNNLRGQIKNVSYPDLNKLFDEKVENKGSYDDISQLLKDFIATKSMEEKDFNFKLNGKEFWFDTKTVKPALDFVKTLMDDKTELHFNDSNLKLEYSSEVRPLKITFFCLNALVVQILIAPIRKRYTSRNLKP